jgi:threonine dehydrogenase-like Zn-dependent dehydrogenase
MLARTLPLLQRRRDVKDILITHRFKPEQAEEAFELVRQHRDGVIKAVLDFTGAS